VKAPISNLADFAALDPFFRIIEQGLDGLAGPGHFFDAELYRPMAPCSFLTIALT
jgi:hypothetical protein